MLLNCGAEEDSWESLGLQDQKEIKPEYSLEGLMLKLKLQEFGHLMQRADSLEKILMLGKIEGRRRRGDRGWDGCMASPARWPWVWASFGSWWCIGRPGMLQSMGLQTVGHNWATELPWWFCSVDSKLPVQERGFLWSCLPLGMPKIFKKEIIMMAHKALSMGCHPGLFSCPSSHCTH